MFIKLQNPSNTQSTSELFNTDHAINIGLLEKEKAIIATVGEFMVLSVLTTPPNSLKPGFPNTICLGKYSSEEQTNEVYNELISKLSSEANYYEMPKDDTSKKDEEVTSNKTSSGIILS